MVERTLFGPGGATEDKQDDILVSLAALLTELQQKLEPGGEVALNAATLAALETINAVVSGSVALDAGTLAALESITAAVSNFPSDYPDAATLAKLETIRVLLAGTLAVSGTVAVSNPGLTDTQLRATPVPVLEGTGLVPKVYDFVDLGYTGENLSSVVYKTGGAGGTTVATLALTYAGDALDTVTRT